MKIAFVFNQKTDTTIEQAEFDTPETIEAIHTALSSGGHEVMDVDMKENGWQCKCIRCREIREGEYNPDEFESIVRSIMFDKEPKALFGSIPDPLKRGAVRLD